MTWSACGTGDPSYDGVERVLQLEALAREALDAFQWTYLESGAGDERTLTASTDAWAEFGLSPHSMVDVSGLTTSTTLLGQHLAHPVLVAPTAAHARFHPGAEVETLRGAKAAQSLTIVSSLSSLPVSEVGAEASRLATPWWMQVYLQRDRSLSHVYLDRAVEAGAGALVLTVDSPSLGARRDHRDPNAPAPGVTLANLAHVAAPAVDTPHPRRIWNHYLAPDITPADITALHARYGIPVLVKGILRADDARRAVDAGAAGVIVSNHGGRNLDTAPTTASVLASIVDEVGLDVPVIVDGGIRRGTDIATALCLGASAVLVGRPVVWGLATYGAAGVQHVLDLLRTELEMAMALLGAPSLGALTRDLLLHPPA